MKNNKRIKIFTLIISFLMIFAVGFSAFNIKKLPVKAAALVYEQAEEPDVVSIQDIAGKNKISLTENKRYTYTSNAAYGSVIFKFELENNKWDDNAHMQIYLMLNEDSYSGDAWWNSGNYFWFQSGNTYMMQQHEDGERFIHRTNPLSPGNHQVEVGRIAVKESDDSFAGKYYCFIKVDGAIHDECFNHYDPSAPMNQFHITGRAGNTNKLVDSNWTGNLVKYMVNKVEVDSIFTKDYLLTKPADPVVEGKTFMGWFDELGNQWDFAKDEVLGDMTLTAGFVSEESQTIDNETYFDDSTFTPVLRFIVSSDTHIGDDGARTNRLSQQLAYSYSFAEANNNYNKLDAALYAGDLSDNGSAASLGYFKSTMDASLKPETQLIVSMGNHEFRFYKSPSHEIKVFEETFGEKCDAHYVINGFHFIALSPNLEEGYHFSDSKIEWLEEQLAIAAEDTPDKPIFLIQHEGIKGTVYGSINWGMDELTPTLCKYPQIVDFSGHSHYPLSDPRSIWQGTFTALGTGTLHYSELGINGYKNGGVFISDLNGGWSTSSTSVASTAEFQIVEVDANNAMRVIVYDLLNNREITRYYMRDLLEDRKFTYSHTERAKVAEKPYFDADARLNLSVNQNTLTVEFNQAKCKDIVESYRIELYKNNKLVQTEYALSDYFLANVPNRIRIDIPYLDQTTEYMVKVYAVNVWNMESDMPLVGSATTENVIVYEDVIDEISLHDLMGNDNKTLTTDKLNSYKVVHFTPSENNVYGSFKLTMQLLYVDADFQICFNEEFNNDDLIWAKQDESKIWFIKENFHSDEPMSPGLHIIEYQRRHETIGQVSYTVFSMKVDDTFYHEYWSTNRFTNNGYFSLNFNSCYAAGSRYYDISEVVPRTTTPTFSDGHDIELTTPMTDWADLGGALTFDSQSSELSVWLEDASGRLTNNKTFAGKFTLGDNGDYYHYEIKTNKFDILTGITGNEAITKICFAEANWKIGNLDLIYYEAEELAPYDEISILDIGLPENPAIYSESPVEKGYLYNGTSPTYSAVLKYYLICNDLNTTNSEFRSQLGTLWSYYCTLWMQPGNYTTEFFGFQYSTRPIDRYSFTFESHHIYLIETGTIRVAKGEWAGWNYTYFKIDGNLMTGFYVPANECVSNSYQVAFKIVDGYEAADISLARNIEYIVDDKVYSKQLAISGANIYAPEAPTKEGKYFTGWYTQPTGGERLDFTKKFSSNTNTVRYYARFSEDVCNVNFYNGTELYQNQKVGEGGQALVPDDPTKIGTYKYDFVNWVIKGTDEEYDFASPVAGDIDLEAVFVEHEYRIVYKLEGKDYITKYYRESNPTEIIGLEPDVPNYKGAVGYWDYAIAASDRTKGDTYAIARFDGANLEETNAISLVKFNGEEVDIADELTRYYLSFADSDAQGNWLVSYPTGGGHERQDITFSWSDSSNNTNYVVYFADNADFENAFAVKTNKTSINDVGIFTPGETYYWKVVGEQTNKASAVDTFKVINIPVRWISAGPIYNMRDLGGWTTTDGKQVKYGMFYRGGQLRLDQSGEASYMNDYSHQVFDYLGIKTEIELRGESVHTINQFNEFEKMIYVNGNGYNQIFTMNASACATYRNAFAAMADESNYPFYFHCSWGADRTGFMGFAINALLGVPYEQLVQDFELTSLSYSGLRSRYSTGFNDMCDRLLEEYGDGGDLKQAVNNYLVQYVGVKQSEIDALRSLMLTDASAAAVTHTVTYMIDGSIYLKSNVLDGGYISSTAPQYFDKHLGYWTSNGEIYDFNKPVTEDLVLEGHYVTTHYEDYDVITVRDLDLGESWAPYDTTPHSYVGTAVTGSRMFEFDYEVVSDSGDYTDGVHVEIGAHQWLFKAHVWFADADTQHIFTNGTETPTLTLRNHFEYGRTYHIQVGVLLPLDGPNAGDKLLVIVVDGNVIAKLPCNADLTSNRNIGMAGLQGILHSTANEKAITFKSADGEVIDTINVQRGQHLPVAEEPVAPTNKVFTGWYDELGNKWNFENDIVYNDVTLFARFGDLTTKALVLDDNDFEIVGNYQVIVGLKVSELETPKVKSNLEFVGWYNGETLLSDNDVITDGMNLICRFKVIETKEEEPDQPDPIKPEEPTKGCKSSAGLGLEFITLITLGGALILRNKKK